MAETFGPFLANPDSCRCRQRRSKLRLYEDWLLRFEISRQELME